MQTADRRTTVRRRQDRNERLRRKIFGARLVELLEQRQLARGHQHVQKMIAVPKKRREVPRTLHVARQWDAVRLAAVIRVVGIAAVHVHGSCPFVELAHSARRGTRVVDLFSWPPGQFTARRGRRGVSCTRHTAVSRGVR